MRIAIVDGHLESRWVSCSTIAANIKKTYKHLNYELKEFNIDADKSKINFSTYKTAENVFNFKPDIIALVDYKPIPDFLINCLNKFYSDIEKKPKIIIHVYGDFTIFIRDWIRCNDSLKNFEVKILAASHAQAELVKKFVDRGNDIVNYQAFPVDCEFFKFDPELVEEAKANFDIKKNEFNFVYTGRLTLQKNTFEFIKLAEQIKKFSDKKINFLIAGNYDDIGYTYFGKYIQKGEYKNLWHDKVKLIGDASKSIKYLGVLNKEELKRLYHAGDCFVSFSTHNDEDFGMSPAEAFCCGLDGILTAWGGLKSFKITDDVKLVETQFSEDKGGEYSSSKVFKKVMKRISTKRSFDQKQQQSSSFVSKFSVNSLSENLKSLIEEDFVTFEGFSTNALKVAQLFEKEPIAPFLQTSILYKKEMVDGELKQTIYKDTSTVKSIYRELYESYIG